MESKFKEKKYSAQVYGSLALSSRYLVISGKGKISEYTSSVGERSTMLKFEE